LNRTSAFDSRADRGRCLAGLACDDFIERDARDLDVQIDPIE